MAEGDLLLTLPIATRPRSTDDLYRYVLGEHAPPTEELGSAAMVPVTFRRKLATATT